MISVFFNSGKTTHFSLMFCMQNCQDKQKCNLSSPLCRIRRSLGHFAVMNPRINDGGLSLPLRANLIASRSTTERDNRHHDRCPRDIDRGVPISVIGVAARDTTESGLTLAVRFCTVAALATSTGRVARVNCVQWHTC